MSQLQVRREMAKQIDSLSRGPAAAKPADTSGAPAVSTPFSGASSTPVTATPTKTTEPTPSVETAAPGSNDGSKSEYDQLFPEPSLAVAGPPAWIWWLLLLIASVVVGIVGFKLTGGKVTSWLQSSATPKASPLAAATPTPSATATPTPTATATATPVATPTPTPSAKASISLRVLNGTTIAGAASKAKATLENDGFTVRTTGNATHQTYTSTVIYYQTGQLTAAQQVAASLSAYSPALEESTLANPDNVLVVVAK